MDRPLGLVRLERNPNWPLPPNPDPTHATLVRSLSLRKRHALSSRISNGKPWPVSLHMDS